jgi:hypothetical protein
MNRTTASRHEIASDYIRSNFQSEDRLAVVLLNKQTDTVIQRLAAADRIAAPDFQRWLRHENAQGCEVYISMNALKEDARGRTKSDVAVIRHVYLDFDENGTAAVDALLKRADVPRPNYSINSSPDKWQIVWKVEGFTKSEAEQLQKILARQSGADPAATDCARVLRLPGFYNHKYAKAHFIRVKALGQDVHQPNAFPPVPSEPGVDISVAANRPSRGPVTGKFSQSERDWAYAKRALMRGESPDTVIAAIASWRRYDKHNPRYYAELTVRKAAQSLGGDRGRSSHEAIEHDGMMR